MSDQAAEDDFSGLGGFFFYVFIVHPCTAWILKPGRFERKKSIMYAIGFLAALAAIKTGEFGSCFDWILEGYKLYQGVCPSRSNLPHFSVRADLSHSILFLYVLPQA